MAFFDVKDLNLAPSGAQKIAWVRNYMPLLRALEEECAALAPHELPLAGVRLSISIHMEAKTAYFCQVLRAAGASVRACGCNVLSTQDDVAAALAVGGVSVFAVHGEDERAYQHHLEECLEHLPHVIIDDGGDLVHTLHTTRPELAIELKGGCEETTTGVLRLRALEREGLLRFPMIAVNDARMKHLFDNRYGTGQSVLDSLLRNTNLLIAGKTVVVAGYGWCGRGIALRAAALGARVVVCEVDPVKAVEASLDGYQVLPMSQAAPVGDFFITATGCKAVVTLEHMRLMKDNVIVCNAGHFNVEVDVAGLAAAAVSRSVARPHIESYTLVEPGREHRVQVIAEGRLVNIAAADGHPAEIMDLSFSVQYESVRYVLEQHEALSCCVTAVSAEIDERIARRVLAAWGTQTDQLTREQEDYLRSWQV